jgi:hypothetical protein
MDLLTLPPLPEHDSVNVLFAVSADVVALPDVARDPLQAPEAVHDVPFDDDQLSVDVPPLVTEAGFALSVRVGAGAVTVTRALAVVLPPVPVHVIW